MRKLVAARDWKVDRDKVIRGRARGGESVASLMKDYGLSRKEVEGIVLVAAKEARKPKYHSGQVVRCRNSGEIVALRKRLPASEWPGGWLLEGESSDTVHESEIRPLTARERGERKD